MINPLQLMVEDKLAYLMIQKAEKCFNHIAGKMTPEMMTRKINQKVFKRCLEINQSGNPVIPESLDVKRDSDILLQVTELHSAYSHINPDALNLDYLIALVFEDYKKRRLKEINLQVQKMNEQNRDSAEIMEFFDTEKMKLNVDVSSGIVSMADILDEHGSPEALAKLETSLFPTGYSKFDSILKFQKGDLIYLAARPGMGKTDFSLILAKQIAGKSNPVGVISLEMREEYLMKRLLECTTVEELAPLPIYVDQSRRHNLNSLIAKAMKMKSEYGIKLLVVDYLTLIDPPRAENRNQEVTKISRELKLAANKLEIPFLILCQLNRKVEERRIKKPVLSDLRDSGSIEQDADAVIFLYRPAAYGIRSIEGVSDTKTYLEVNIAKNRDGAVGTIPFYYCQAKKTIYEMLINSNGNNVESNLYPF
jgi:replicative DNA helicase